MTDQPVAQAARAEVRRAAEVGLRVLHGELAEARCSHLAIADRALLAVEPGYEPAAGTRYPPGPDPRPTPKLSRTRPASRSRTR